MKAKSMNRKLFSVAAVVILSTHLVAQTPATVELTNHLPIVRQNELITLPRAVIEKQLHSFLKFISVTRISKKIPIQLIDDNSDGKWDKVIFVYSFKANEKADFQIFPSIANEQTTKQRAHIRLRKKTSDSTFGPNISLETMPLRNPATDFSKQLLPMYLTEGPAWENDKVAFRLYFDVRNNKDIYGKTTSKMMMDTVGANAKVSYHNLADWGMDVLHVAKSLGAGAIALSVPRQEKEDTLIRLGGTDISKTIYQQIADGPLLARCRITYNWQINNKPLQLVETVSIWEGQYFYDSKVTVTGAPIESQLVTGFANYYQNNFGILSGAKAVMAFSHGKQAENKDNLGLAILVNKENFAKADSINKSNTDINDTYYVAQTIPANSTLYYRFYACWERTDKRFRTLNEYKNFLKEEIIRYSSPIEMKWKHG